VLTYFSHCSDSMETVFVDYLFKQIVFIYCYDLDADQNNFKDQFIHKPSLIQNVHILFLATVLGSF